ncbi:uncharacterized protein LY89DRAFT_266074 [Mollisia scopiformis]|uniref:Uncharacterized protein n=1 Tax=Mollisia scopiformis TaxID=149040 RepID=A0A132BBV8_MOLSC|nr:uncharacterized protein LY89DRAFT_266074 [Mollisia scopiformis]KUJ09910.1 hypothetical protein LY89DRAFT_266074 [Mollisia scopiformis]
MKLWVLASRLRMARLQDQAIDMLEMRIRLDDMQIETKYFGFVYNNTVPGDALRRYIIDFCVSSSFESGVQDVFPWELRHDIFEEELMKKEVDSTGIHGYHVVEESGEVSRKERARNQSGRRKEGDYHYHSMVLANY